MHKNVTDHEPREALFVEDHDPLKYYRAITGFAFLHLLRPGLLYFEINENFGEEIKSLLLKKGFEDVKVMKDINGKERFIRAAMNSPAVD
jgi:release factor glutamine methyltransferase